MNLHVRVLNLCHNLIDKCEGIAHMQFLHALDLSHNAFSSIQSIQSLACNSCLQSFAFSFNRCGDSYHGQIFQMLPQIQVGSLHIPIPAAVFLPLTLSQRCLTLGPALHSIYPHPPGRVGLGCGHVQLPLDVQETRDGREWEGTVRDLRRRLISAIAIFSSSSDIAPLARPRAPPPPPTLRVALLTMLAKASSGLPQPAAAMTGAELQQMFHASKSEQNLPQMQVAPKMHDQSRHGDGRAQGQALVHLPPLGPPLPIRILSSARMWGSEVSSSSSSSGGGCRRVAPGPPSLDRSNSSAWYPVLY
jgi:hypothetical protein